MQYYQDIGDFMSLNKKSVSVAKEEIDLLLFLKNSVKHYKAIIAFILIFTLLGGFYASTLPPEYVTTSTMMVEYVGSSDESQSGKYAFSENIANTFALLITDNVVLNKVSKATGNKYSVSQIKSGLTVENERLLIHLKFKDTNKHNARIILNEVMKTAIKVADSKDKSGDPKYKILFDNLKILSEASSPKTISSSSKYIVFGFALGFVLSILYCVICILRDKKFNSAKQIEEILGIPVLTTVPFYNINGRNVNKNEK